MDKIFLRDLRTEAIIGIFDWERKVRQTIGIDLEIPVDIRRAARTDDVADTLNYKAVAKRLLAFIEQSEYHLVETLAEELARLIIREFDVDWVKLTLNKPGAIRGARDVGVMIERSRSDYPE
jgi:dihydroneopterin aldolase